MNTQLQSISRHDLEARIVKRSWQDESFRKEFTSDPTSSFGKYLEIPAASLPRISIHEEQPGSWHIVVPAKPANQGALSESDLEKVAGGATPVAISVAVSVTASASIVAVSYVGTTNIVYGDSW